MCESGSANAPAALASTAESEKSISRSRLTMSNTSFPESTGEEMKEENLALNPGPASALRVPRDAYRGARSCCGGGGAGILVVADFVCRAAGVDLVVRVLSRSQPKHSCRAARDGQPGRRDRQRHHRIAE